MSLMALPIIHSDTGLSKYLQQIAKFPILSEQEEYDLAVKWHESQDLEAAHFLVTSHLRLVAKIAIKFSGYGLPVIDIISEGNLGLMHAVKKYTPYNGNRFSTYAIWWIKAYIQDYVLKSWSLVKMGTSATKKKLFYNLNRIKNKLSHSTQDKDTSQVDAIAKELNVDRKDVIEMNGMMSNSTISLNRQAYEDDDVELIEMLPDLSPNQEITLLENDDLRRKKALLTNAMQKLTPREQDIIGARMLQDKPATLDTLSKIYGISCERIRQIEAKAFDKLKLDVIQGHAAL
ncbi:RNA polymerase factor sigma-32 [endosymbiont of Acanthamoeba sp. UWC8]|uniref:RNA polymerase factor sigma-32 n=1 Tax=endosymbiont of Acanthamoeba sp. UWC8 TaxID=86106 RepID=UPI0004D16815|nr:RNA polymerase factor sigma-32 [endosymbiont of Acanthamoeba sp. UWC8]AIF80707.1 RNA polymerase factor sigma-32 [endosymbiont of Acanthamoeba sp. UWC8]